MVAEPALAAPQTADALVVEGLRTEFRIGGHWYPAVRDLSLRLRRNETLALVGESGSGKSVTALSLMGLVAAPAGRVAAGRALLEGQDIAALSERAREALRGNRMAMIFQEPMTSLNPLMTVGDQVAESLRVHRGLPRAAALDRARALFEEVKIPSAAQRLREYPPGGAVRAPPRAPSAVPATSSSPCSRSASRRASRVAAPSARAGRAAGSRYSGAPGSAAGGAGGSQRRSSAA